MGASGIGAPVFKWILKVTSRTLEILNISTNRVLF